MPQPRLFDAHTHLQFAAFNEDKDAVIARTLEKEVWMVNVGTQRDTSRSAVELAEKYPEGVYAAVGLHPIHAHESYHDPNELGGEGGFTSRGEQFNYEYYKKLALHPKVVAIGECGFDYYRIQGNEVLVKTKQSEVFENHIQLASEVQKPLMIHTRPLQNDDAYHDVVKTLVASGVGLKEGAGIIHFFVGSREIAQKFLDLGFSFTFGGVITFARDYDEVIKYIPLERILTETDAPYVTPNAYRGKRNEPLYVEEVIKKIAEIKHMPFEEVAARTVENARRVFKV